MDIYNFIFLSKQSVLPFLVATKMSGMKTAGLFSPFPDTFVRAVLEKVGKAKRCFGYWPHELQVRDISEVWQRRRDVKDDVKMASKWRDVPI